MKDVQVGRPQRAAYLEPLVHAPNAALLIDFDNVTMGIRSDLQNQLRRLLASDIFKGKVSVQRAYADWRRYPQYIVPLSEASIDLIFAPAFGSNKKNATDIRLAIDALELVFTRPEIGTFILLSGDSDFSSLVLKLKEYAKYVIGVGIRESSSDLLIQNCDEYYGYTELTGLTKEGEVESVRRDPWELVVEAVLRMKEEDDVMRSDRLKQVMQAIDANFDEKEAGFNRFSKFVQECGRRGLLALTKLDNGQYAIDVGPDANVPPGEAAAPRMGEAAEKERSTKGRRRRPERRARAGAQEPLALAEAFELLKQSLWVLGAVGEESAAADDVRKNMIDLFGDEKDPVFDSTRFKRFLRQAHDADLIDLIKSDDERYLLKLSTAMAAADMTAVEETDRRAEDTAVVAQGGDEEAKEARHARSPARKSTAPRARAKVPRRGESAQRSRKAPEKPPTRPDPESKVEPKSKENETTASRPDDESAAVSDGSRRNPRYRRGSRSPRPAVAESAVEPKHEPEPQPRSQSSRAPKTLGPRSGRRGIRPERPVETPARGGATRNPAERSASTGTVAGQVNAAGHEKPTEAPPAGRVLDASDEEESLLRRMTAALHRMVGGPTEKREDS